MANQLKYIVGSQWVFANFAGDFAAANGGPATSANNYIQDTNPTEVELDWGGTITNGGGWQSAKTDLGASRPRQFALDAAIEFAAAPTAGSVVSFYWAPSPRSAAAIANPANLTGSSAAWTVETGQLGQMIHIGDLVCDDDNAIQVGHVGVFEPPHQYGILVVYNQAGQTIFTTAADESYAVMTGIVEQAE